MPFLPDPTPTARTFKKNAPYTFQVKVTDERSDYTEKIVYRIGLKCLDPGAQDSGALFAFKLRDFRESVLNHTSYKSVAGGGQLTMGGYGLPIGLESSFKDIHFWMPLLDWFLPTAVTSGAFKVSEDLGDGITLTGDGTVKDRAFELKGKIGDGKAIQIEATLKWSVSSDGWLTHGEGKLSGDDDTLSFTIDS